MAFETISNNLMYMSLEDKKKKKSDKKISKLNEKYKFTGSQSSTNAKQDKRKKIHLYIL